MPQHLKQFKVQRKFRGAIYRITINRGETGNGVKNIVVNDQKIDGDMVPVGVRGAKYSIEVQTN